MAPRLSAVELTVGKWWGWGGLEETESLQGRGLLLRLLACSLTVQPQGLLSGESQSLDVGLKGLTQARS